MANYSNIKGSRGRVTAYANFAALPTTGNAEGALAFTQDTDAVYIWDGSEWDRISAGVDESPVILTEPPTITQSLNTDGSTSTVTMTAQDLEGFDITYGIAYKTAGNALPDQLASATAIDQTTGVYTFTPSTNEADAGSFRARLSASDGANTTTRLVDFDLQFVPIIDYLIVAGGGGGGGEHGGGGGAGGVLTGSEQTTLTSFDIIVGSGGTSGGNSRPASPIRGGSGGNSEALGFTSIGGGGGGGRGYAGGPGGSGGGSGPEMATTSGSGTSGQGNRGGIGSSGTPQFNGGGGGGAGAPGVDANPQPTAGDGGVGIASFITGTEVYYAGGGGGCAFFGTTGFGAGGLGGGGRGATNTQQPENGTINTGGGGGGANRYASGGQHYSSSIGDAGIGGSGVVILRTLATASATTGSPTVTTDGSYNIYTFTASGSITF